MASQAMIDPKFRRHPLPQRSSRDESTHRGLLDAQSRRRNPKAQSSDLAELISGAIRAVHVARDKGFYTVSHEALRCIEILNQIKGLRLTAKVISKSNTFSTLQYLTKNGNPKIQSEARSLLHHWRNIPSVNRGDQGKVSCLTRKPKMRKFVQKEPYPHAHSSERNEDPQKSSCSSSNGNCCSSDGQERQERDTQSKTLMGKRELLELFEDARKAAKAVKGSDSSSGEASRCISTLKKLSQVPRTLARNVILTTDIGSRLSSLTEHSNLDISCAARSLLNFWRMILFTTGRDNGLTQEHWHWPCR